MSDTHVQRPTSGEYPADFEGYVSLVPEGDILNVLRKQIEDVQAVARTGADALLFPNIESRADVENALKAIDAAGGAHLPVMLLIESPIGVLRAEEIASASDRIACIVLAT